MFRQTFKAVESVKDGSGIPQMRRPPVGSRTPPYAELQIKYLSVCDLPNDNFPDLFPPPIDALVPLKSTLLCLLPDQQVVQY